MCRVGGYGETMSNTEYSRKHQLRVDDGERQILARLVMQEITQLSTTLNSIEVLTGRVSDAEKHVLRRLRSLLERLTD